MNSLSLILRIIAILAAVASAGLFFMSSGKLKEKESQLTTTQQSLASTQSELGTANEKVTSLTASVNAEKKAASDFKAQVESLRSELYTAKQETTRAQTQLSQSKSQIAQLENEKSQLNSEILSVREQANASQESAPSLSQGEIDALEQRVEMLEGQNQDLKDELSVFQAKAVAINAGKPRGTNGEAAAAGAYNLNTASAVQPATLGSEATITKVSAEDGLVVLSASPDLDLNAGLEITLVKDLKALGKVQVVEAEGSYALANILPGTNAAKLQEGSVVNLLR
ncbi:MAG: hypothetical protein ACPGKS_01685 [Coraliomargarita sp.]